MNNEPIDFDKFKKEREEKKEQEEREEALRRVLEHADKLDW